LSGRARTGLCSEPERPWQTSQTQGVPRCPEDHTRAASRAPLSRPPKANPTASTWPSVGKLAAARRAPPTSALSKRCAPPSRRARPRVPARGSPSIKWTRWWSISKIWWTCWRPGIRMARGACLCQPPGARRGRRHCATPLARRHPPEHLLAPWPSRSRVPAIQCGRPPAFFPMQLFWSIVRAATPLLGRR
jgi:hypothetical protein